MTAWLTRIVLDTRRQDVRHDLRDAVALHQRVMQLVPDQYPGRPRQAAGVLFRFEDDRVRPSLLVQTRVRPVPSRLPVWYGHVQSKDLGPLLAALRPGVAMNYRIVANTSKRLGRTSDHPGRMVPLRGPDAEQWWMRRAAACGLSLRSANTTPVNDMCGSKAGQLVRHAATQFDGIMVVTDPDVLRSAILAGIGRGKAYGCGLLSVAPFGGRS